MVSDSLLVNRLREILRGSDLETATAASVRRRLEEEFSVDLYGRRTFVREQIDLFLQNRDEEEEIDENTQNDVVGEEQGLRETVSDNENSQEEEEEEGEEEEEEEEKKEVCNDDGMSKRKKSTSTDAKKKGGGFTKPCALSPQLHKFLGVAELARTEVVKKIWAYIRERNLQNPKDKRKILCDESLHGIFRVKSIDMFQMNKALSKHIWPLDEAEATPVKSSQRERPQKREAAPFKSSQSKRQRKQDTEGSDESKRIEKPRKGSGGLAEPLPLSDALLKFFGTGEVELSRAGVVKRMWQYIKENELQDPSDKRMILCDEKLKELFGVDSFHGFTVSKLLVSHFIKTQG